MLAVGTKVMYAGQPATITQVDVDDPILPYLVELKHTSLTYWVGDSDITTPAPVYQVTEEAINAVKVETLSNGDYATNLFRVVPSYRTPEALRDTAAQHIKSATHYEALARYMESQVDPDEDAKAVYYEAFPEERGHLSWDVAPPEYRVMARNLVEARK